tara:strand:- start:365 stop:544 length:180 start_codon:yes stop_codon:yes gene_type:complete
MTSKSSRSVLLKEECKTVIAAETSTKKKFYFDSGHKYQVNKLSTRPIWFKGSRSRGLKE